MAILEITLEKPALIEERRYPGASDTDSRTRSGSSSGGKGRLLGLLVVLAGVAVVAWRLRSGGSDEYESEEYEHGPEPEIGGDDRSGVRGKVAGVVGLAVALVSLVAASRKVRR